MKERKEQERKKEIMKERKKEKKKERKKEREKKRKKEKKERKSQINLGGEEGKLRCQKCKTKKNSRRYFFSTLLDFCHPSAA